MARLGNDLEEIIAELAPEKRSLLRTAFEEGEVAKRLLSLSPDITGIFSKQHDGWHYTNVNAACEELVGKTRKELQGSKIGDHGLEPEEEKSFVAGLEHTRRTGESTKVTVKFPQKDSHKIYECQFVAWNDGHVQSIARDITNHKQIEEFTWRVYDEAPVPIAMSTPQGKLTYMNLRAKELLKIDDINNYTAQDLYRNPSERTKVEAHLQQHGELVKYELDLVDTEGSNLRVLETSLATKDWNGQDIRVILLEDITQQEKEIREREKAQKMEATSMLAGGIAHDFNNMLMIIQGYAELMHNSCEELPEEQAALQEELFDSTRTILQTTSKAANLTKQLLTLAREDSYNPKVYCINEVIGESQPMIRGAIRENIDINLHLGNTHETRVEADRSQLEQVLINLVVNAAQAMPEGGKLDVQSKLTRIAEEDGYPSYFKPGEYVEMTVSDTGKGIPKDIADKIFEPFFTTKKEGSGLGLATIYSIVKRHEGYITHESSEEGTTFRVYLPRSQSELTKTEDKTNYLADITSNILLVEDDPQVGNITKRLLERTGHNVTYKATVKEGLDELVNGNHDLLISDMQLKEGTGPAMVANAKQMIPQNRFPAHFYITGYAPESFGNGINTEEDLLYKPFSAKELREKVSEKLKTSPHRKVSTL